MIISGSTALGFFDRTEYSNANLDLFVDHRFRRPIVIWLKSIGYNFLPRHELTSLSVALEVEPIPDQNLPTSILVFDFIHTNHLSKIQLITTSASPLEVILRFHSSECNPSEIEKSSPTCSGCVMNLITHDKAYSIFPRETFENRRSLIFDKYSAVNARSKYEERGWTFVKVSEIQPQSQLSPFRRGVRRLGDSKCWSISLHHDQYRNTSVWESNSWKLMYTGNNATPMNIWVLLDRPSVFHFTYLVNHRLAQHVRREYLTNGYNE